MIQVFTDGGCSNNGKDNAKAGIGVYFGVNDPRNISRRIQGKQTNNTAELSAVIEVFSVLKKEILSGEDIIIYSDSEYTIRCCDDYGEKCKKKQWKNKKGYIPNHELVQEIYEYFQKYPNVSIHYIAAHTGLEDKLSMGNDSADTLATQAIN
jgi:ribonuclease HI